MKREGYGSTSSSSSNQATAAIHKDTNLSTPQSNSSSIRRNVSAQSARSAALTVNTHDTESLLGENLLLSGSPAPNERGGEGGDKLLKSMFLSPTASESDVPSIIDQDEESVHEVDIETSTNNNDNKGNNMQMPHDTPKRTGASPRKHISRGSLHSGTNGSSDPTLIGLNVITNELDTLAYSRDPDESTLLTNDNFTKRYLSSLDEEGKRRGLLWWIFKSHQESYADDPPYMLVCLGLAVGICLCSIAALAYVEYNHHMGRTIISTTDQNATSSSSSSSPEGTWHGVPYTQIGRESFGDSVSSIMDVSLFHPSLLYDQHVSPSDGNTRRRLASSPKRFLKVPFPTGSFWTNLVLLPQKKQETKSNQFSYPIVAYPYAYQWSKLGKLQASYSAARRVIKDKGIQDAFAPDITLSSVQEIHTRHVVRFDSLSVTLRFYAGTSSTDGNWETYIVQGSPYITAKYTGLAPELSALSDFVDIECPPPFNEASVSLLPLPKPQHRRMTASSTSTTSATPGKKLGICAITSDSTKHEKVITGVQFVVTTKEGLTMLVFASEPITFKLNQAARRSIQSLSKYSGVIRVAIIPPSSSSSSTTTAKSLDTKELATSTGVKRLIYHAGAYPTEGSVSWDFISGTRHPLATTKSSHTNSFNKGRRRLSAGEQQKKTENNIGRITFAFKTSHMTSSSPGANVPLLMLALPHHAASISFAEELLLHKDSFDLTYQSIKGDMTPVTGNIWTYEEELTFLGFGDETLAATKTSATSQRPIIHESTAISTLDQSIRDLIISNVESDLNINLPVISNGAYGFGKQIARIAQVSSFDMY